jgi:hypothetical protein
VKTTTVTVAVGHKMGMRVPHGGSTCAKCQYVSNDKKKCSQELFVQWNKGETLPAPAMDYCCDQFEAAKAKTMSDHLQSQKATKA